MGVMQSLETENLHESGPAVFHLSLVQGITERSRSIWSRVRTRRYAKRLFRMTEADLARQEETNLFNSFLTEHLDAMRQQVWYSDMEGDMEACDHCGEKIYGILCRSSKEEVRAARLSDHARCACGERARSATSSERRRLAQEHRI